VSIHTKRNSVWQADLGDGRYQNPVLYADYSDPDIIRVGEDFYMTASSFVHTPGLPILHSKDLVNWTLTGYAVDRLPAESYEGCPRHGDGVWAPSLRYHAGKFWIFFGMPDEGVFMTTAVDPAGPWTPLHLVKEVKGWIDTCPFWDDDGQAYLVHAFANSRCGIKHRLDICRMKADGTELLDEGVLVFNCEADHPTMEGPKLYKRNGWYYIFAPAGGVSQGWQTVLRSRSILGPYEDRIVLHQGSTDINGPHQGGYVELESGESWFLHFQDREAYGRIVHLQPMRWEQDWPVMGINQNDEGMGEPVSVWKKPDVGGEWPAAEPDTTDDFNEASLGLQWQWQGNYRQDWYSLSARPGFLRLYSQKLPEGGSTLYHLPGIIGQKLPAPQFAAIAKLEFQPAEAAERAGLIVFGHSYAYVAVESQAGGRRLVYGEGRGSKTEASSENELMSVALPADCVTLYIRAECRLEAVFRFGYSLDGLTYHPFGQGFAASPGGWVGAKLGLFARQAPGASIGGFADVDSFYFEPLAQ
jgi:beta-xylosidase